MSLNKKLAGQVLAKHPEHATTVLERLGEGETIRLLDSSSVANATSVLERFSPQFATLVMSGMKRDRAAQILDTVGIDVAARLVRRLSDERRDELLALTADTRARGIRSILQFREGTAGAIMDPDVLALPSELSAREALQRVRKTPEMSRYNLYVVDQSQRLVGVLNLRELLLARGPLLLADLMVRDPLRVLASADRASVLTHPGWKQVHALPVVDEADVFLGVLRYRVLRQLEDELLGSKYEDAEAGVAFGQVIAAGARGLLGAVAGSIAVDAGRSGHGANKGS